MEKKAIKELFAIMVLYSLIFLIPSWCSISSELSRNITSVLLLTFIPALFVFLKHIGLWNYLGLEFSKSDLSRIAKESMPYCVVLVIPLLNILFTWKSDFAIPILFMVILICSAVVEELCFRGYLLSILLCQGYRQFTSVLVTAIIFGLLHFFNIGSNGLTNVIAQFVVAVSAGTVFGFSRLSTNSIYPSIIAHILINITSNHALLYDGIEKWILCIAAVFSSALSYLYWKKRQNNREGIRL